MYTREDFYEAFERVKQYLPGPGAKPAECIKAFGVIGPDCEWEGGFVVRLTDATVWMIAAFCDCEGWDVVAGSLAFRVDAEAPGRVQGVIDMHNQAYPERSLPDVGYWDCVIEDINEWIYGGCKPTEIY